ncbi:M48 family metallopeptidase [Candidatus Nomurabacteria bacterium]|nr:M48 family metallopeptidase [Candidatus Nomurabacteria bacterium]
MRTINIIEIGEVKLKKSRLAKRLILKIDSSGNPVVTIPSIVPYAVAKKFAIQNASWIEKNMNKEQVETLMNGSKIGSEHVVLFKPTTTSKISSRVQNSTISISYPHNLDVSSSEVQAEAKKASVRALRAEANEQLPSLLSSIAEHFGYKYKSVSIKKMNSRWGSCSSSGEIVLNIWLMQLPEDLINYVLCHELAHLNNHNHQAKFWSEVEAMVPDYKILRKQLKNYQPKLKLA